MNKELSEALLDFYQKILAPEFETIQKNQAAHDGKFIDILGNFDDLIIDTSLIAHMDAPIKTLSMTRKRL